MPPKRSEKKVVGTVVRTTRRIVKETVQVAVVPSNQKPKKDSKITTVPVEDHEKTEDETQTIQVTESEKIDEDEKEARVDASNQETKKTETKVGKQRKKRRGDGGGGSGRYKRYMFRVLKQVHPDLGMSAKAMTVLNGFMVDMFERPVDEAVRLSKYTGRRTLGAVRLILPEELGKHAIAEGNKAVASYMAYGAAKSKY